MNNWCFIIRKNKTFAYDNCFHLADHWVELKSRFSEQWSRQNGSHRCSEVWLTWKFAAESRSRQHKQQHHWNDAFHGSITFTQNKRGYAANRFSIFWACIQFSSIQFNSDICTRQLMNIMNIDHVGAHGEEKKL